MTTVAILGFGKVGQNLLETIKEDSKFGQRFQVKALWNRSAAVFEDYPIPSGIKVYNDLDALLNGLDGIDLVIECAHPAILQQYATDILSKAHLFISSPTAFADVDFRAQILATSSAKKAYNCYLPLGASVGIWDLIRLDQSGQLASVKITMRKDPDAFKITAPQQQAILQRSKSENTTLVVAEAAVASINAIAPQNTNTMAVYALAASSLGFDKCRGRIVADPSLSAHLVELEVVTKGGLKLHLVRDNPAKRGAVTGSATFGSFLSSLYNFQSGIAHNQLIFC